MLGESIAQTDNIFQTIKENTTCPEVFQRFHGGEIRCNKTFSPFREERTPSFHLYPDGWKDYGTGEYGDSVDFVARLLNISPLEAAKAIAKEFGIAIEGRFFSREDKLRLAQAKAERQRQKRLQQAFDTWCREAGTRARVLAEAVRSVLDEKGIEIYDDLLPMVHLLPIFEFWADALNMGTDEEKLELYKNQDVRWWIN